MFCKNCGTKIEGEMKFCPSCGTVVDKNNEESNVVVESSNEVLTDVAPDTSNIASDSSSVNNVTSYQSPVTDNYTMPNPTTYGTNYTNPQVPNSGMQQPMYNQPYGNPTNNGKKNNSIIFIIVGIVVAFIVCVGIIIYSNNRNSNNNTRSNSNITSNSNSNIYSNSNITSNSNSNIYSNSNVTSNYNSNVTSNGTTTDNTIKFKGYLFQVPSTYRAQTTASQLQLIGKNNTDVAAINVLSGNYESIKASKETINSYMTNAGYTVNNIQINYYNGVEFVTAEVVQNGKNMILGYAKLNATTIFMVVTANTNNVLNYNALNEIAPMITTVRVAS